MSTVQTFQGHEGRNSSRVLAPPGGRSSIFFSDENAAGTAAPITSAGARRGNSAAAQRNASSSVFDTSAPAPVTVGKRAAPITQVQTQQEIAVAAGKHRDVHTSSRVLAPPGGHCHNIFG